MDVEEPRNSLALLSHYFGSSCGLSAPPGCCARNGRAPNLNPKMKDAKGRKGSRDPNQIGFSHFPGARRMFPQELLLIWRSLYCFLFCLDHKSHPGGRVTVIWGGVSMRSGSGGSVEEEAVLRDS